MVTDTFAISIKLVEQQTKFIRSKHKLNEPWLMPRSSVFSDGNLFDFGLASRRRSPEPEFKSECVDAIQIIAEQSLVSNKTEVLIKSEGRLIGYLRLQDDLNTQII